MKYLCLVYMGAEYWETTPASECMAHATKLQDSGQCLAAQALRSVHTATTVRVRNGRLSVTDGPFTETKEQLAGFYLIETPDLDDAIRLAAGIPLANVGSVEIRPIWESNPREQSS